MEVFGLGCRVVEVRAVSSGEGKKIIVRGMGIQNSGLSTLDDLEAGQEIVEGYSSARGCGDWLAMILNGFVNDVSKCPS